MKKKTNVTSAEKIREISEYRALLNKFDRMKLYVGIYPEMNNEELLRCYSFLHGYFHNIVDVKLKEELYDLLEEEDKGCDFYE